MRYLIAALLCLYSLSLPAQSIVQHQQLYRQGKTEDAFRMAQELLKTDTTCAYASYALGQHYRNAQQPDTAIRYLEQAIAQDGDSTWISGWSHVIIGKCYLANGFRIQALQELKTAVNMGTTMATVDYAGKLIDSIEMRNPQSRALTGYSAWIVVEGKHITYKFQDTVGWSRFAPAFIARHERAYAHSDSIFQARLPQKLVLQVWKDRMQAKEFLGKSLGFANPEACVCNIHLFQSSGHELTHVLAYWAWGRKQAEATRFITEGIAVAFDGNTGDRYEAARHALKDAAFISVLNIWENDKTQAEEIVYPVGGAFITYLYANSKPEEFKDLVRNQTIAHAQKIFGAQRFTALVAGFDKLVVWKK